MNKKILNGITISLIVGLVGMGAWTLLVEYPKEQMAELEESKIIAASIRDNPTDCEEVNEKLMRIIVEDFDGVELIRDAWLEKKVELECADISYGEGLVVSP